MERTSRLTTATVAAALIGGTLLLGSIASRDYGLRQPNKTNAASNATLKDSYAKLPISFEPAPPGADTTARFVAHGPGYSLELTDTEAVLALRGAGGGAPLVSSESVVRLRPLGANSKPSVSGFDVLPGKVNYFIGNEPSAWRVGIPTYAQVVYRSIYPGIDLVYDGSQGLLEQDFIVAPGADPGAIRLTFAGAEALGPGGVGELVVKLPENSIRVEQLHLYQEANGRRQEIAGGYLMRGPDEVGFQVGSYDPTRPLVIDPVLTYSTYLGGGGTDVPLGIAVDSLGDAYVTGDTQSTDFPTASPFQAGLNGGQDAFVAKFNPAGNALVYSTYLGGSGGDEGRGIAVDSSGNAYVSGSTGSTNFPTVSPLQASSGGGGQDAFVAKLNASGSALIYSTYMGGSLIEYGVGIAVDSSGSAYVSGYTASTDFPTVSPLQASYGGGGDDAFVAKLNASGSALLYSTYLGGSGFDFGDRIAIDGSGNAYVTGGTLSTDFPTASPIQAGSGGGEDAFVAKLNAAGSALAYSTYLGGSADDFGAGIAVDGSGSAYVSGYTASTNFPTASPLQASYGGGSDDAFLAKLNASGSALVYSTYLGGSGDDLNLGGIALDSSGDICVTGSTTSTNFPTASPFQASLNGAQDVFVAKLNALGSGLIYSTYLGGSGVEISYSVALDNSGYAYLAGATNSGDFPTANPYQANAPNGGFSKSDGFVTKLFPFGLPAAPNIGSVAAGNQSATIGWTAPANNGGDAITGYRVTPYIGAAGQTPTIFNSTALTETVTGLMNGNQYTFTVAAINGAGVGPESSHSSAVTPEPTVPGQVTNVQAIPGDGRATVTWSLPAADGGSAITGYQVTPHVGGTPLAPVVFNSTSLTETITGLIDRTYTFTVAAINTVGVGAESAPSNAVTIRTGVSQFSQSAPLGGRSANQSSPEPKPPRSAVQVSSPGKTLTTSASTADELSLSAPPPARSANQEEAGLTLRRVAAATPPASGNDKTPDYAGCLLIGLLLTVAVVVVGRFKRDSYI